MRYEQTIKVDKAELEAINRYLEQEPEDESECLDEDDKFSNTATFPNGYSMDIECCGVQYEEGSDNTAWTQAVLYDKNGCEVAFTDVEFEYEGEWELEDYDTGDVYVVNVEVAA